MSPAQFSLFDTAVGRCGVAWSDAGVLCVQLPESSRNAARRRLVERFDAQESVLSGLAASAVERIQRLLSGQAVDLSSIPLDMGQVPPFHARVYTAARGIPIGQTRSYGSIATELGTPGGARAVGQALGRNPFAIVVPCHRVLAANGKLGGFTAAGGVALKQRLLDIEEALTAGTSTLPFDAQAAVAALRASDPHLRRVIDLVGPCRLELKHTTTVFAALAEAIVYQQLTGKAAATIFARLCALFPRTSGAPTPQQILRCSDERLRSAGLSAGKQAALRDLAQRTLAGELPTLAELEQLDECAIVDRLTVVRGIGRWTVEMLLIFRLGRPDVLPLEDYGVRKGYAIATGARELPSPKALEAAGARWRPYRSVASWYLWRAVDRAAALGSTH